MVSSLDDLTNERQVRGGGSSGAALLAPLPHTAKTVARCVDDGAAIAIRTSATAGSSRGGTVDCAALMEHVEPQRFISGHEPPLFIEQQHDFPRKTLTPAVTKTTFSRSARAMAGRTHLF